MFELSVVASGPHWLLQDDRAGELGRFGSRADALAAAVDYARVSAEPRMVLICDDAGEWDETLVEPAAKH